MTAFVYDLGYPEKFGDIHYALYQPVLRCCMLTLCNLQQAKEVKFIASSRYSLYIVDLTTAVNYAPNLIDNDCCHGWDISNVEDIEIPASDFDTSIDAERLIPTLHDDPDIFAEKKYLQIVWHYVKYIQRLKQLTRGFDVWNRIDQVIDINIAHDDHVPRMIMGAKKISKLLYLELDADSLDTKIQEIIDQNLYGIIGHDNFIS